MAGFAAQPDEGYSEDPLNALSASSFTPKQREDAVSALASIRSDGPFPPWLAQHISSLSVTRKTELAMAILSDLPTSAISQIVEQLNPRLYIDFIRYLPPEVCLKILGYLDPVSLINVARSCRAWYDLALDWKLWEQLYYMEGWRAKTVEIEAWEQKVNGDLLSDRGPLERFQSRDDNHASKRQPMSLSHVLDDDVDTMMEDAEVSLKQEPIDTEMSGFSIFGNPSMAGKTSISQEIGNLEMHGSSSSPSPGSSAKGKGLDKGKGKAVLSGLGASAHIQDDLLQKIMPSSGLPQAALWMWDGSAGRFKLNWRYLYTMRRRLESNWELGKYSNFQLPHPDHPEEGHGECIYSLQFNEKYLVSGSRDRSLKVWDLETRRCLRTLTKHRGSVLCLQFDSDPEEDIIVSGSSDSDVIIWSFSAGKELQTLRHAHRESVLNVKFDKRILVTCSKDKTIKIFNRRPLRYGDLGYQEVDPVPKNVKNYGYTINMSPEDLPQMPAWTMIGCLEGHSAAVNAVQIHDREVVSASGDRHIKVWDWPSQSCTRTIVGHTKGIACVQYDGRRIVSGSSDNEVKVFDRQTGLEVASLRSHSNLVRTVQAGFGDLPSSAEDDAAEAKKVDAEYFKALESGRLGDKADRPRPRGSRRLGNAGSKKPEDICAYGAKLPPGGGGGKYGRIVSGSYDTSIIIWRRDKEGIWKDQHHLKQEEAAVAAMRQRRAQAALPVGAGLIPLHPSVRASVHSASLPAVLAPIGGAPPGPNAGPGEATATLAAAAPPRAQSSNVPPTAGSNGAGNGPTLPPPAGMPMTQADSAMFSTLTPVAMQHYRHVIDQAVQQGQQALARALVAHPQILALRAYVEAAIDRQPSPVIRSQLRQTFSTGLIRAQFEQARQRREAIRNQEDMASGSTSTESHSGQGQAQAGSGSRGTTAADQAHEVTMSTMAAVAAAAHQAHAQPPAPHGVHLHQLQYDARRIICCSQTSVIVGWDFCNGDADLEEASRFFGHVQ